MSPRKKIMIGLGALCLGGAATAAVAALGGEQNDALAMPRAKVTLAAAAGAAEQHAGGYATNAEYERTRAGWAYDVEIVAGAKVYDVRVNADTGAIISSAEDVPDQGGEAEEGPEGQDERD